MQFQSITALRIKAEQLVVSYSYFEESELLTLTDIRNGPRQLVHVRSLASHAKFWADTARTVMADPGFSDLDPKLQTDVTQIAEENEAALVDIDDATHPDFVWERLSHQQREDSTGMLPADEQHTARIRARMRGELRGQKVDRLRPPKP